MGGTKEESLFSRIPSPPLEARKRSRRGLRGWLTVMCSQGWQGGVGQGLGRVGSGSWERFGSRGANWIAVGTDVPGPLAQVNPSPLRKGGWLRACLSRAGWALCRRGGVD